MHTHTHKHASMQARMHSHTHTCRNMHKHMHMHTNVHAHTHAHAKKHTCASMHMCAYTSTQTCIACTHGHIHTYSPRKFDTKWCCKILPWHRRSSAALTAAFFATAKQKHCSIFMFYRGHGLTNSSCINFRLNVGLPSVLALCCFVQSQSSHKLYNTSDYGVWYTVQLSWMTVWASWQAVLWGKAWASWNVARFLRKVALELPKAVNAVKDSAVVAEGSMRVAESDRHYL